MPTVFQSRADFHQSLVDYNQTTTDGWDVIVSYSEDKLNALLRSNGLRDLTRLRGLSSTKSGLIMRIFYIRIT